MSHQEEKKDNSGYTDHFTRIPNILFTSYKHLTKEEKWLFSSLRCLFWNDSTPRYHTLRELATETGYSIGALSKMLPRLHLVGLIHAEIKRKRTKDGQETGNALYHITIVDIWELNRQFYSCSPNEQVDPSAILVHEMIQACSRNDTSLFTKSDKPITFGELDHAQLTLTKDIKKKTTPKTKEKDNSIAPAFADHNDTPVFLVHPLFSFLTFDDLITPSVMRIELIPFKDPEHPEEIYRYWSEPEEKHRTRTAWEVEQSLKANGVQVRVEKIYKALTWNDTIEAEASYQQLTPESVDNSIQSDIETSVSDVPVDTTSEEIIPAVLPEMPLNAKTDMSEEASEQRPIAAKTTKKLVKPTKPEMPPEDAQWSEETAVQIIEAVKGRRYGDTTRAQEKTEAKKVLKLYYGDEMITRKQFEQAIDDMFSWAFWKEHTNVKPMIKTLRKDDKILNILDDLEKKDKRRNGHPAKTDRVNTKNVHSATQTYSPEDYDGGDVERRQREAFMASQRGA